MKKSFAVGIHIDNVGFQDYARPAMSKTFQESLAQKKRQQQIEAEQRRLSVSLSRENLLAPSQVS